MVQNIKKVRRKNDYKSYSAKDYNADFYISIHYDVFEDKGVITYYRANYYFKKVCGQYEKKKDYSNGSITS